MKEDEMIKRFDRIVKQLAEFQTKLRIIKGILSRIKTTDDNLVMMPKKDIELLNKISKEL